MNNEKWRETYTNTARSAPLVLYVFIVVAVLAIAAGAISIGYERWQTGQQAQIERASYQHVHGVETYLEDRMQDYQSLTMQMTTLGTDPASVALRQTDLSQQRNIIREMHDQAATIPANQVPTDVQDFLRVHATQ